MYNHDTSVIKFKNGSWLAYFTIKLCSDTKAKVHTSLQMNNSLSQTIIQFHPM